MANGLPAWPGGNKQTNVHNSIIAVPNGGSHIIGLFDIEKSAQPQFFGPMWVITHSPSTFRSSGVLTKIATPYLRANTHCTRYTFQAYCLSTLDL